MKMALRVFSALLLLSVAGIGSLELLFPNIVYKLALFNPIILPAIELPPSTPSEARQQDLRYLRKLIAVDRSFSEKARQHFQAQTDAAIARADRMSAAQFYLAAAKAVALADNGHTNLSLTPLAQDFKSIPAKFYWFADGLFIVRADGAHGGLVGARVTAIEGRDPTAVFQSLSQYRGGAPQWRRLYALFMLECPDILHAAGLAASPDAVALSLHMPDGAAKDVSLPGRMPKSGVTPTRRSPWMNLKPEPLADEEATWVRALSAPEDTLPLAWRATDAPLFSALPGNGLYIRTQSGFGTATQTIPQFYAAALAGIGVGSLDYLVVDLRLNSGGDYTKSTDFAKTVPSRLKPGGRLYLMTGPQTFSAAIVTTAMLKHYSGGRAAIVGTPVGDRAGFWAESGFPFTLPNSGYRVSYATGYHDWENGCSGHPYCFGEIEGAQVAAGSLAPNTVIDPIFADYAAGRDAAVEWILSQQQVR